MASHRGAGALHSGALCTGTALNGGQRWHKEETPHVINGIPVNPTRSHSDAVAIGAAWKPSASLEPIKDVAHSESYGYKPPLNSDESESAQHKGENPRTANPVAISQDVAESSCKDSMNLPHSQATTEVIVRYAVPQGQRYLPITLNDMVTMLYVGSHGDQHVYELTNDWLTRQRRVCDSTDQ